MTIHIDLQLEWLMKQVYRTHQNMPKAIAKGKISQERADAQLARADATLETFTRLREGKRGEDTPR